MKIIHVLANGTVLDSIEGHIVQPEDVPELYEILRKNSDENQERNGDDEKVS